MAAGLFGDPTRMAEFPGRVESAKGLCLQPPVRGDGTRDGKGLHPIRVFPSKPGAVGILIATGLFGKLKHVEPVIMAGPGIEVMILVALEMQFPDLKGAVAGGLEFFGDNRLEIGPEFLAVFLDAGGLRVAAGHKGSPARHAEGVVDETIVKGNAVVDEAIDIGSVHGRVAMRPDAIESHVIGGDPDNVSRSFGHRIRRGWIQWPRIRKATREPT